MGVAGEEAFKHSLPSLHFPMVELKLSKLGYGLYVCVCVCVCVYVCVRVCDECKGEGGESECRWAINNIYAGHTLFLESQSLQTALEQPPR